MTPLTQDSLDGKAYFRQGLLSIRQRLQERYYTSVAAFSADLAAVFSHEMGVQPAGDTAELQMQISGRAPELSVEQREKRKLAKRIIKAIQPALEDALMKESELNRRPYEKELRELDLILEKSVLSRRDSVAGNESFEQESLDNPLLSGDEMHVDASAQLDVAAEPEAVPPTSNGTVPHSQSDMSTTSPAANNATSTEESAPSLDGDVKRDKESISPKLVAQSPPNQKGPLTPPMSSKGDQQLPLSQGGIPWYMQPFDPVGTTIHEERWIGRDVMRGMSEELSELDEEELKDLVDDELEGDPVVTAAAAAAAVKQSAASPPQKISASTEQPTKVHRTRRRWRGFK